jgi:hypothetical protein
MLLSSCWRVFTARYGLVPYIKRGFITVVEKCLQCSAYWLLMYKAVFITWWKLFTAGYGMIPYIKQFAFRLKIKYWNYFRKAERDCLLCTDSSLKSAVPYSEQHYIEVMLVECLICKCLWKDFFVLLMNWGKLMDVVECLSRYASEIHSAKFWATNCLLTCSEEYIIVEIKQNTFIEQ